MSLTFVKISPSEKTENNEFKEAVKNRLPAKFFFASDVSGMLGLSSRALAHITSSFLVLTADSQKINLGLSLKFEAKSMKVLGYSRKNGRAWEFSERAVNLICEYKVGYLSI